MLWELFSSLMGGGEGQILWELFSCCYFHICCLFFSVSFLWGCGNFTHMTSLNWGWQKGELGHSTVFYGGGGGFYSPLWFGEGEGRLGSFYRNLWLVALFWRLKAKGVNARCEYRLWDCSSLALSCPHPCVLCVGVCVCCACAHCFSHSKCERPVRLRISCMVMCGQRKWSGHSVCCPRVCGQDVMRGHVGVCLFWIRIFNVSCEIVSCSPVEQFRLVDLNPLHHHLHPTPPPHTHPLLLALEFREIGKTVGWSMLSGSTACFLSWADLIAVMN